MAMAILEKHTAIEHFPLSLCKELTITKSKNENLKFTCGQTINLSSSLLFSSHQDLGRIPAHTLYLEHAFEWWSLYRSKKENIPCTFLRLSSLTSLRSKKSLCVDPQYCWQKLSGCMMNFLTWHGVTHLPPEARIWYLTCNWVELLLWLWSTEGLNFNYIANINNLWFVWGMMWVRGPFLTSLLTLG
jgi:hypothetical protein